MITGDREARIAWHEAECGDYREDLAIWRRLAGRHPYDVLELGCGTGRVAADLARHGHRVVGLDRDAVLLAALRERDSRVRTVEADVRDFDLDEDFDLILAPMQMLQLLTEADDRRRALSALRRHLRPGGRFAAALLDIDLSDQPRGVNLLADEGLEPERRRISPRLEAISRTLSLQLEGESILTVSRRRELIATGPIDGSRQELAPAEFYGYRLRLFGEGEFEAELARAGFALRAQLRVPPSELYVGSRILVAKAA